MIRPLRQIHRRVTAVLGVVLPTAFFVGIAARQSVPGVMPGPGIMAMQMGSTTSPGWEHVGHFPKAPVVIELLRSETMPHRVAIRLSASPEFLKPDLLVYWADKRPDRNDSLPPDAILLGAFASGPLWLPDEVAAAEGCLILFSLADQEIVDVSKPVRFHVMSHP